MKTMRVRSVTAPGWRRHRRAGLFLDHHRLAAGGQRLDAVDEEAVLGEDRLVAGLEIGMGEQAEQFVGTVGTDDVGRVQPVRLGDRLAERQRSAVGIEFQPIEFRPRRLDRRRRRAERALVGGQFPGLASCIAVAARHIGSDFHHAGAGSRATLIVHGQHFLSMGQLREGAAL
jgi:hypothetical protein